jgi:hypothetical protein
MLSLSSFSILSVSFFIFEVQKYRKKFSFKSFMAAAAASNLSHSQWLLYVKTRVKREEMSHTHWICGTFEVKRRKRKLFYFFWSPLSIFFYYQQNYFYVIRTHTQSQWVDMMSDPEFFFPVLPFNDISSCMHAYIHKPRVS